MIDAVAVDTVRDAAPRREVIAGAVTCLRGEPDLVIHLVGPSSRLEAILVEVAADDVRDRIVVHEATESIGSGLDPVIAVRATRGASIRVASALVRDGHAGRLVTVGDERAAVAAAEFDLGRRPGMRKAGLAAVLTVRGGHLVTVADAGAQQGAPAQLLVSFAVAACEVSSADRPRVALLSPLGELRGTAAQADELLRASGLDYTGPIDVASVLAGAADVVVTDGPLGRTLLDAAAPGAGSISRVIGTRGDVRVVRGSLDGVLVERALLPSDALTRVA